MEDKTTQPIAENLWWVIPNKLAGVRKPTEEELPELQKLGIGAIVSLMDDSSNLELYKQANLPYLWLPTKGGTAPSREQIQQLQDFIDSQNNGVVIHCSNGKRRTATAVAGYLIISGSSYDEAMEIILTANSEVDLRESQSSFLQVFAKN
ncbi:MAG: dual specificity protein phosphatase family protein [Cyanobacteriota bacterium]|nr:dual specificity protein phosphatase family protein [Cyanobacteriota bacterium]